MTLDLSILPPRYRPKVRAAYEEAEERAHLDAELSAAYDAALPLHGYPNALTEVAEAFGVTPSRVRVAKWGK